MNKFTKQDHLAWEDSIVMKEFEKLANSGQFDDLSQEYSEAYNPIDLNQEENEIDLNEEENETDWEGDNEILPSQKQEELLDNVLQEMGELDKENTVINAGLIYNLKKISSQLAEKSKHIAAFKIENSISKISSIICDKK